VNELLRRLLMLPPQASSFARHIDYLHYSVILTTLVGATAVAGAAAYFVLRYRRRGGAPPEDPKQDPSANRQPGGLPLRIELAVVLGLLALFVAWWAVGFSQFVMLQVPPRDALPIYASGKQWMWTFIYPNGTTSNGVLFVPAGQPVKLILSSRDVIHSFYVPEFRIKKDVLPGQVTTVWFDAPEPCVASLYCAEYCGTEHSLMLAEVHVLSPAEYAVSVGGLEPLLVPGRVATSPRVAATVSLASIGQRIAAEHGCLRCHTVDGTPHLGPSWAGLLGSTVPLQGGRTVVADEAYVTESMMDPRVKVRESFEPLMPSYQGLIDAPETAAIIEYIRTLSAVTPGSSRTPLAPADVPSVLLPRSAAPVLPSEPGSPLAP
jgi:cytochrome c oxidase subunit II